MHLSGCVRALGICATALGRLLRRECGAAESEAIFDTTVTALQRLNSPLAGKLQREISEEYCRERQPELVCGLIYLASPKQYQSYCARAPFPTLSQQAVEEWIINTYDDQGELGPLETMRAEEELALWPSGSLRAEMQTYASLAVKGRMLREAEKKMRAVPCQSAQHSSGLDEFARGVGTHMGRLEAQDMPKLQFLNWYYRSFGGLNQAPLPAPPPPPPTLTIPD